MKHLSLYLSAILSVFPLFNLSCDALSLAMRQRISSELDYSNTLSVNARIFQGRATVGTTDLGAANPPKLTTFAFKLAPIPSLSLFAGAISSQGIPALARKLAFSLSSPFYRPRTPSDSATLSLGSSSRTKNVALEYRDPDWGVSLFSGRLEGPESPSWIAYTRSWGTERSSRRSLEISGFVGTLKTERERESAWFLADMRLPETDVLISGLDCAIRAGCVGGSLTGFVDLARFRRPEGAGRAELFVECGTRGGDANAREGKTGIPFPRGTLLVSAGAYSATRRFLSLEGSEPSILSRLFLAPVYSTDFSLIPETTVSLGALAFADTLPRAAFNAGDSRKIALGSGIKIEAAEIAVDLRCMGAEEEITLTETLKKSRFVFREVSALIGGKTVFDARDDRQARPKSSTLNASLDVSPAPFLRASGAYSIAFTSKTEGPRSEGSIRIESPFRMAAISWRVSLDLDLKEGAPLMATLTLTTEYP